MRQIKTSLIEFGIAVFPNAAQTGVYLPALGSINKVLASCRKACRVVSPRRVSATKFNNLGQKTLA